MSEGYVCAINRSRDGYQVPMALWQAGLLKRFVTDFYAPDQLRNHLPKPLGRRHADGLPSAVTRSALSSFFIQSAAETLQMPMRNVFDRTDRMLANAAGRVAQQESAHLYCYSRYLPPERMIPKRARRIVFEYHPLPGLLWEILKEDNQRFPQTDWSFRMESNDDSAISDWKRADAIACASSVTKRSLVRAGCDPDRVTVIPYGFDAGEHPASATTSAAPTDICEFLFVGQGVQRKGLHHLIEAWQSAGLTRSRLTLVCYRIDPGIRDMIRDPSIQLLGRQDRSALDALYDRSPVFIMPSLIEGFGLVYLEAAARGCHVVGTTNTGLPDLGLPAEAATILLAGDIQALAKTLQLLEKRTLNTPFNRHRIQEAAGQWTWREFRAMIAEHARSLLV